MILYEFSVLCITGEEIFNLYDLNSSEIFNI
jgi:hypothetical protein